ncbi:serine/threonine-protein kinase HipA [Rhodothalassium salexigens DSM 2132]|uniref:Serine/threonine-protein kinase HipA n=1 Tax=Rhodothalassium salexigens DSM 2132 TaxID=1188247 RepID=A0A4R2P6D7_RHOSA|nr:HipA domain-containing protein [Rhodothalassium salexigens]MBB4212839.1 serine/threonine-protein kinase HipA [Rhodothalassium salexigens DSM 2132]MBK1640084.1 phosphatidylinositol kinase [Rhodothalassium salexigens DSM 2132]TCP29355.1 serine/threonine-protein kinase HipA [Rhodothalassium salexigens DSM 2132]
MTSKNRQAPAVDEAYVWVWLPGATEPVVAGRVYRDNRNLSFNYGRSYLKRDDAVALYLPELPLEAGAIPPAPGLSMAGCLRDGAPDAWGRRVILNRRAGIKGQDADIGSLDDLTYLLDSGSDRIGALDFQTSPTEYVPREAQAATLEELLSAAEKVDKGIPLTPELDQALYHGSSLGGARPKAMIEDGDKKLIAKFSSSTDLYNVVKAEFIAMRLAEKAGLCVAPVRLEHVAGKDVLLVERFDRIKSEAGWQRKAMVSALTIFGLDEMMARYASYADLTEIIRHRFTAPKATLRDLFRRLVFNIVCGNTDDHARNHAAFWDGRQLTLTPAYDICPQSRTGNEASQAMLITVQSRRSTLATCMEAAASFHLDERAAATIIKDTLKAVRSQWQNTCAEANLSKVDQNLLWERMFLNPSIFDGADDFR